MLHGVLELVLYRVIQLVRRRGMAGYHDRASLRGVREREACVDVLEHSDGVSHGLSVATSSAQRITDHVKLVSRPYVVQAFNGPLRINIEALSYHSYRYCSQ